jgi:hypothetical protein
MRPYLSPDAVLFRRVLDPGDGAAALVAERYRGDGVATRAILRIAKAWMVLIERYELTAEHDASLNRRALAVQLALT